jgi:hypothetical protein
MRTAKIIAAALLGLGFSFSAHAQTPVVGTPGAMTTPGSPATPATGTGAIVPGQPSTTMPGNVNMGTGVVSPSAATPMGTSGTMSPNGVPSGTIDAGTLRSNQPMSTPGSQPTRRSNRGTRTTTNSNTNTTTTRP